MGTLTNPYNLYKPSPTDFTDVELDLNNNLKILDQKFKGVFDYQNTDVTIVGSEPNPEKSDRFKYYKTLSNSVAFFFDSGTLYQDNKNFLPGWVDLTLLSGWNVVPGGAEFEYNWESKGTATGTAIRVSLVGTIRLNTYDAIVTGTTYTVATLPSGIRPTTTKAFTICSPHNQSVFKLDINTAGNVNMTRYGPSQTNGNTANEADFSCVEWFIGV